jgi:D-tyrosyl-tRNA(Tyr) deacylase
VDVAGERVAEVGPGLVVLLGVGRADRPEDGERLAVKIAALRIFEDQRGRMGQAIGDVAGEVLVVPQFTLHADIRHGRRPDFTAAADPAAGERLYTSFCGVLRSLGVRVQSGRFGAMMRVLIDGDGPVTIVATTDGWEEANLRS